MEDKLNLIYVASNGRSGSTLLEILVGKHPQCCTVGELQMLPNNLKYDTLCGCGSKVSSCELWSQVYLENKSLLDSGSIAKFRNRNAGKVIRIGEIIDVMFNKSSNQEKYSAYGQDNFQVLTTVSKKIDLENMTYFIDSSKDPYRLKWLALSGYFNIYVLHIIKEPQAMVYSFAKGRDSWLKTIYWTIRMSLRWVIENIIIKKFSQIYVCKENVLKVKYEVFAQNPDDEMDRIFKFLSLGRANVTSDAFEYEDHGISGNAMRFKSKEIRLDKKWEKDMGLISKLIVLIITAPFKYLYK